MILLALLLASIGCADLVRPQDAAARGIDVLRAGAVGAAVVVLGVWGAGLSWWWIPVGLAVLLAWIVTTPVSGRLAHTHPWPIIGLGVATVAILASGNHVAWDGGWLTRWYDSLDYHALRDVPFDRFAVTVAYLVFLVDSANIIVRMVLTGTDAKVLASERSLRGGRVLGPLERIFLFAMGLSGQFAAMTAVIAAKGILRFPEISRDTAGTKAEYVLVGSFVSWALALALLPIL
ncbi:MAG: hypothetical protein JWQ70_372 [Aeromicrobium sp.]|nr:hypothetical protein [Aeromicrobium sp.]